MSIAPIAHSVEVKAPPDRAFELFAANMGAWWPRGRTPAKNPHVDIILEPREGGRWFERDSEGNESQWGKVLAWEPPRRLLLGWQLDHQFRYDAELLTEVELRFAPLSGGGTRVTLEHRDLERFGADAEALATKIRAGWPVMIGHFEQYAASHH
jgi:uncharacterized protein YndB with AHSA1/START domain